MQRSWRYWIVDLPATIISGLFKVYVAIVATLSTVAFILALATVVMHLFGARWERHTTP